MSNHTPICALCGSPLTRTHTGDLDAWVCPTGHGLAVTLSEAYVVAQEDELAVLWERGKSAAAGIRRCPMCENAMTVVSLGVDDDEQPEGAAGDGPATATVKVDLCAPCQVLWFDGNELAGLPTDQPDAAPSAEELAHVAEIRRLFGEAIEAAGEARGHSQVAERLISFAARSPRSRSSSDNAPLVSAYRSTCVARSRPTILHAETARGRSGQIRWRPHSVLSLPPQRPERGSSPSPTGVVQGKQPIDG